jgi:hypothetical protein
MAIKMVLTENKKCVNIKNRREKWSLFLKELR